MKKFCVFCGQAPENKNKEHVLPQWLIRMTGDSKRIATFGVDFSKQPFAPRQFSFDALTFPACSRCNDEFGRLEALTEPVVRRLISNQAVSGNDLTILLDWLDKVRVGLWLGYLYLDKNPMGITPSFHIRNRVGQVDRMVAIIKLADHASVGLSFFGPESKFYHLTPTCFGLRVNGLCLVNASGISLCTRRLGFPYAEPVSLLDDHKLEVSFHPGTERIMYPVERSATLSNIVSLYQPVYRSLLESDAREYVETVWVTTHTADCQRGYGKLFLQKDDSVRMYPEGSSDWIPSKTWKTWEMVYRVPEYIYGRLSKEFEHAISISSNRDHRKHMRRQAAMIKMMDRAVLQKAREAAARIKDKR